MSEEEYYDPTAVGQSELFGARYFGPYPAAAGQTIEVLSNPLIRGLPSPIAVHLFSPDRNSGGISGGAGRALISYSNGAANGQFRCDWDGQFSLVCNKITIQLESYETQEPDGSVFFGYAADPNVNLTWGALLGIGAIPSGGRDPIGLTLSGSFLNPASSVTTTIPDFARRFYPQLTKYDGLSTSIEAPTELELAPLVVRFADQAGNGVSMMRLTLDMLRDGIPIFGAAQTVALINDGPTTFTLVPYFKLGL